MKKKSLKEQIFTNVKVLLLLFGAAILVAYISLKVTPQKTDGTHSSKQFDLSFGDPQGVKNPTQSQIEAGIRKALSGEEEFAIISHGNSFVQMTDKVLEHRLGAEGIYQLKIDALTFENAREIFLHFQENPAVLNKKFQWENITDHINSLKDTK